MQEKHIGLIKIVIIFLLLLSIGFLAGRIQKVNKEYQSVKVENLSIKESNQLFPCFILDIFEAVCNK